MAQPAVAPPAPVSATTAPSLSVAPQILSADDVALYRQIMAAGHLDELTRERQRLALGRILGVLSDDQRRKWREMTGDPYPGTFGPLPGMFPGGPRGPGGPGGARP